MELCDRAGKYLTERGVSHLVVTKAQFLIEEVYGLIGDNKKDQKKVFGELTLLLGEDLEMICRDSGRVLDLTEEDKAPDSFRAYTVSMFVGSIREKSYARTVSFNRSRFVFTDVYRGDKSTFRGEEPLVCQEKVHLLKGLH